LIDRWIEQHPEFQNVQHLHDDGQGHEGHGHEGHVHLDEEGNT
jgi:hypothetical protein